MNKKSVSKKTREKPAWILFFYTVPSKPVKNRIKFWRRLAKAGAVQLKGAVYVLPHNEEHYEFCQWLMAEVAALGGDGDFVITDNFEMLSNNSIISLFKSQREEDYNAVEKKLNDLEVKLSSMEKGSKVKNAENLRVQLNKLLKEYTDIKGIDFFPPRASFEAGKKIISLQRKMTTVLKPSRIKETDKKKTTIHRRNPGDYKGRVWITRRNPFVDRMASAWLIRKFIDRDAAFQFIDQHERGNVDRNAVIFDMKDGEITHIGDNCTFEVLVKSFAIKDKAVRKIAQLVHELDIKDEKFSSPEAKGIGEILLGIRKTGRNDKDILKRGMDVFEMLYASNI
ncbi:MAG: chromate resistance protein ChrB domain-containing protein [Nitrospirota bacterium]